MKIIPPRWHVIWTGSFWRIGRTRPAVNASLHLCGRGARDYTNSMFEFFEHTADLGLRVRAADLDALFVDAARALTATVVENPEDVEPREPVRIALGPEEPAMLLFDWLDELLYRFDTQRFVGARFEVAVRDQRLEATVWGETLDPARHRPGHEVKAITYHGLRVEREGDGWLAEAIVDI